jgi:hypothetical protein
MQHSQARKRTELTTSRAVAVIGIILLLSLTSYVIYIAIDTQAKKASLSLPH